jgi:hypothetical protein
MRHPVRVREKFAEGNPNGVETTIQPENAAVRKAFGKVNRQRHLPQGG